MMGVILDDTDTVEELVLAREWTLPGPANNIFRAETATPVPEFWTSGGPWGSQIGPRTTYPMSVSASTLPATLDVGALYSGAYAMAVQVKANARTMSSADFGAWVDALAISVPNSTDEFPQDVALGYTLTTTRECAATAFEFGWDGTNPVTTVELPTGTHSLVWNPASPWGAPYTWTATQVLTLSYQSYTKVGDRAYVSSVTIVGGTHSPWSAPVDSGFSYEELKGVLPMLYPSYDGTDFDEVRICSVALEIPLVFLVVGWTSNVVPAGYNTAPYNTQPILNVLGLSDAYDLLSFPDFQIAAHTYAELDPSSDEDPIPGPAPGDLRWIGAPDVLPTRAIELRRADITGVVNEFMALLNPVLAGLLDRTGGEAGVLWTLDLNGYQITDLAVDSDPTAPLVNP